jgi:hypothetical protein
MVYLLVVYFLCYQQDAEVQKQYCTSGEFGIADALPQSQRVAVSTVEGYFATQRGCESAIAKAQADQDAVERHIADNRRGEGGYLRTAHLRCDGKELKP